MEFTEEQLDLLWELVAKAFLATIRPLECFDEPELARAVLEDLGEEKLEDVFGYSNELLDVLGVIGDLFGYEADRKLAQVDITRNRQCLEQAETTFLSLKDETP